MACPLCDAGLKPRENRFLNLQKDEQAVFTYGPVLDMTAIIIRTLRLNLQRCMDEFERVAKTETCKQLELMFEIEGICVEIGKEARNIERCGHD